MEWLFWIPPCHEAAEQLAVDARRGGGGVHGACGAGAQVTWEG